MRINSQPIKSFNFSSRVWLTVSLVAILLVAISIWYLLSNISRTGAEDLVSPADTRSITTTSLKGSIEAPVSSSEIKLDSSSITGSTPKASLKINNQLVPIPSNGTVHRVVNDESGNTSIDVTVSSSTSGNTNSVSTSTTSINSVSESSVVVEESAN